MRSELNTTNLPIAVLVYGPETDPAPILIDIVRRLQAHGVALAGTLQHDNGPCAMELELLPSGRRMSISQNLGAESNGCKLDTTALAEAAALIRYALDAGPTLAVFNKFGTQEATGGGLRDEMAAALMAGIPVLTAVGERFLPQWLEFTGGESVQLPFSAEAALTWWEGVSAKR